MNGETINLNSETNLSPTASAEPLAASPSIDVAPTPILQAAPQSTGELKQTGDNTWEYSADASRVQELGQAAINASVVSETPVPPVAPETPAPLPDFSSFETPAVPPVTDFPAISEPATPVDNLPAPAALADLSMPTPPEPSFGEIQIDRSTPEQAKDETPVAEDAAESVESGSAQAELFADRPASDGPDSKKESAPVEPGEHPAPVDASELSAKITEVSHSLEANAEAHDRLSAELDQLQLDYNKMKRSIIGDFANGERLASRLERGNYQALRDLLKTIGDQLDKAEAVAGDLEKTEGALESNAGERISLENSRADYEDERDVYERRTSRRA